MDRAGQDYSGEAAKSLEGRNTTERRGLITISSPVCGLRPRLCLFCRTTNVPKPVIWTFSPCPSLLLMESKMISTNLAASRLEIPPWRSYTILAMSALVMDGAAFGPVSCLKSESVQVLMEKG